MTDAVSRINKQFENLAEQAGGSYDALHEWWDVLKLAWELDNQRLLHIALRNISAECFYTVAEMSNMMIDHVLDEAICTFKNKNAAYSSGTLNNFYRVESDFNIDTVEGILTRMSDKKNRIDTLSESKENHLTEPLRDSYMDLGVYAVIARLILVERKIERIEGYKYAEAGVNVDDPSLNEGDIDEYRRHL